MVDFNINVDFKTTNMISEEVLVNEYGGCPMTAYKSISDDMNDSVINFIDTDKENEKVISIDIEHTDSNYVWVDGKLYVKGTEPTKASLKVGNKVDVLDCILGEVAYQIDASQNPDQPHMIESFHMGDCLAAIQENLNKARTAWYVGSTPHSEACEFLRKIGALCLRMGSEHDMKPRKGYDSNFILELMKDTVNAFTDTPITTEAIKEELGIKI